VQDDKIIFIISRSYSEQFKEKQIKLHNWELYKLVIIVGLGFSKYRYSN